MSSPSADNVNGFVERSRVERGQLVGPRIYTVGDIIYGAGSEGIHQDIATQGEADSALLRIKAEGGPASISYKNYNIPSRLVFRLLNKLSLIDRQQGFTPKITPYCNQLIYALCPRRWYELRLGFNIHH